VDKRREQREDMAPLQSPAPLIWQSSSSHKSHVPASSPQLRLSNLRFSLHALQYALSRHLFRNSAQPPGDCKVAGIVQEFEPLLLQHGS
jgi:hypothetical protein